MRAAQADVGQLVEGPSQVPVAEPGGRYNGEDSFSRRTAQV